VSEEDKKPLNILVLATEVPDRLMAYLDKVGATLVEKAEAENYENLSFILCDNEVDGKQIAKDYLAKENDITLVALSPVKDVKDFLLSNGRLVLDDDVIQISNLETILDRFFLQKQNIHLDESFPEIFEKTKDFKIMNHLALGNQIDQICIDAFERDYNIASVRTFLDHMVYYFTYLKQAGLAGVPFEVEYAAGEELFGITVHAAMKNFVAEYLVDCFGNVNSKDPLQFLLGVAYRSCDFLEVTYIDEPAKLVVTGVWTKVGKVALNGLSFNNVKTTEQAMRQLEKAVEAFDENYDEVEAKEQQIENQREENKSKRLPGNILEMVISPNEDSVLNKDPEKASEVMAFVIAEFETRRPEDSVNDLDEDELTEILDAFPDDDFKEQLTDDDEKHILERVQKQNITKAYDEEIQRVRGVLEDDDDFKEELSDALNEEVANRVSGVLDAETLNKILGGKDEEIPVTVVSGNEEDADDFAQKIGGMDKKKESPFVQFMKDSFEEETDKWEVKSLGNYEETKSHFNNFINKALSKIETEKDTDDKVKSFVAKNAPKLISSQLDRFAQKMGQTLESLEKTHMKQFAQMELPTIMEDLLNSDHHIEEFKEALSAGDDIEIVDYRKMLQKEEKPEVEEKFKLKLEDKLKDLDFIDIVDDKYVITDESIQEDQVKQIVTSTMKETFDEEYALGKANREEIEQTEKRLVTDLSITLDMEEDKVEEIVKGATKEVKDKELDKVVQNIFKESPSEDKEDAIEQIKQVTGKEPDEKVKDEIIKGVTEDVSEDRTVQEQGGGSSFEKNAMIAQLKMKEKELQKAKKENDALKTKVLAQAETLKTVKDIEAKAKADAEKKMAEAETSGSEKSDDKAASTKDLPSAMSEHNKRELLEAVKSGTGLNPEEQKAIEQALQREQTVLALAKKAEDDMKKQSIENQQKENYFKSELEKANRALKAKETVLDKAKDSMKNSITKKEKELKDYKRQVEDLNKRLNDDKSLNLKKQNQEFKKMAENNLKQAEVYRNKLEQMAKQVNKNKGQDNSKKLVEENRNLARTKTALENKLNSELKNSRSLEDRLKKAKELEIKMRTEYTMMKKENETVTNEAKAMKENLMRAKASAEKDIGADLAAKQKEFMAQMEQAKQINSSLASKVKELEGKLKESAEAGKGAEKAAPQGAREKQLDAANKKLQTQISKATEALAEQKKEAIKYKGETVKLQNKIKALEREVAKTKKGGKGGKKAA
jgi:hypothetical protein